MDTFLTVLLIVILVVAGVFALLYFLGNKAQKKQAQQQEMMDAMAQTVSMLIIDKKKMKIQDAGLPKQVAESTPKYMRFAKMPVVKAKVGPRVMTLLCDPQVYELLPVKQEAKVVVSGIYITKIKSVRGGQVPQPKKRKFLDRFKKSKKVDEPAKGKKKN
ncbi:MAG: hypothetical protein IJA58_05160 [Lachnospiraceae bacterium]|nr:hypothetical protein [Lachnospiraceae bacterium]